MGAKALSTGCEEVCYFVYYSRYQIVFESNKRCVYSISGCGVCSSGEGEVGVRPSLGDEGGECSEWLGSIVGMWRGANLGAFLRRLSNLEPAAVDILATGWEGEGKGFCNKSRNSFIVSNFSILPLTVKEAFSFCRGDFKRWNLFLGRKLLRASWMMVRSGDWMGGMVMTSSYTWLEEVDSVSSG